MKKSQLKQFIKESILKENIKLDLIHDINTTRKPDSVNDVNVFLDLNKHVPLEYKEPLIKELKSLEIINFDSNKRFPDIYTNNKYYILKDQKGSLYFVNSEGFNYPRYVAKLKNFNL